MSSYALTPFFWQTPVSHGPQSSFPVYVCHPQPQSLLSYPSIFFLCHPCYVAQGTLPHRPTIQQHPSWDLHQPSGSGAPQPQSDSSDDGKRARSVCPQCWNLPKLPDHRFCSIVCSQFAARSAPRLILLPPYHQFYTEIAGRFMESWNSASRPNVLTILMINWSETSRRRFEEYRNTVETRGQFKHLGRFPGNEKKQFRGTRRACNLGEGGNVLPCLDPTCWICETIRHGFGPHLERKRSIPLGGRGIRLGAGIYTTPVSSKADRYAENIYDLNSTVHAMLVCRAVIGEPFVATRENPALRRPPVGHDCVYGQSGSGSQFMDDEYVFYDEDAVRPAYLVVYQRTNGH